MKKIIHLAVLAFALFLIGSCDTKISNPSKSKDRLLGKWSIVSIHSTSSYGSDSTTSFPVGEKVWIIVDEWIWITHEKKYHDYTLSDSVLILDNNYSYPYKIVSLTRNTMVLRQEYSIGLDSVTHDISFERCKEDKDGNLYSLVRK